jgi:hypothetical protein
MEQAVFPLLLNQLITHLSTLVLVSDALLQLSSLLKLLYFFRNPNLELYDGPFFWQSLIVRPIGHFIIGARLLLLFLHRLSS